MRKLKSIINKLLNSLEGVYYYPAAFYYFIHLWDSSKHTSINKCIERSLIRKHDIGGKYTKHNWYIFESIIRVLTLKLHKNKAKNILDIGSGAGYFGYVVKFFGHSYTGLDIPTNDFYACTNKTYNNSIITRTISPKSEVDLPESNGFDLITSFSITFNRKYVENRAIYWSESDWDFFLQDISFYLNNGGELFLRFNAPLRKDINTAIFSYLNNHDDWVIKSTLGRRGVLLKKCKS